jgi:hypothetical protein
MGNRLAIVAIDSRSDQFAALVRRHVVGYSILGEILLNFGPL